jgi:acyl carrier protein
MEARILEWIRENCPQIPADKPLDSGTRLLDENLLDSLQIVQLAAFLEQEFQVSVPMEEMMPENFETADAVASLVRKLPKTEAP